MNRRTVTDSGSTSHTVPLPIDVVSVQSQVVYGRVGNNAAVPTLEALGLSVAAVPTVILSNTPHYATVHGGAVPIEWFDGYLRDLSERGALRSLKAVLSGYLGSPAQAIALGHWLRARLAERLDTGPNGRLRVVIDPVLGDHDSGLYVDAGLVQAYREHLLALADGLTPNAFELASLTGLPIDDLDGLIAAARSLLSGRTQWIAVTSAVPDARAGDDMRVVLATRSATHVLTHPRLDGTPKGTGDMFSAALTAYWLRDIALPDAAADACRHVLRALDRTRRARCAELLLPAREGNVQAGGPDPIRIDER